ITLNDEDVQLRPYIERVTRKFQGLAKEKQIDLSTEFRSEDLHINMDPDRIEQVLTNLIDNALRHTEENGMVKVVVEQTGEGVSIHVQDSGSGIPEEDLPFVFERFYKADKARTRGRSGTGLGLAITKKLLELNSSTIGLESKPNAGSRFYFPLPLIGDDESSQVKQNVINLDGNHGTDN
ncbi:MAG: cell wall metabolism sensor histidine kinase WalK, partial [candidate division WOR-3 bacterium]|nr:cell wall metabolism sensor histidine kinase WalK [candidate division WOR-3 bacterium]